MLLRKLSRATAALALALVCVRVQAEAPQLPATAIADDTYAVATMSVAKVDPTSLEAAAKAVLGQNFAMAQGGLAKYKEKYAAYSDSGAESVTFVMSGDPEQKKEPVAYLKLKPGADHAAIETKIRADQAKEGKADETDFSNEGDFLVMRKKGSDLPKGGAADRAKTFTEILGAADKALTIAFTPTDAIRAKMKQDMKADPNSPPWAQSLTPLLADSKSVMLEVSLGDAPKIGLALQAADEAGAKGIVDAAGQGAAQLKTNADQMRQGGAQLAGMADSLGALADALKPTQYGSKVTLSLDGKTIGPVVSNFLPFLMMGGGGGARPAPGAGQ